MAATDATEDAAEDRTTDDATDKAIVLDDGSAGYTAPKAVDEYADNDFTDNADHTVVRSVDAFSMGDKTHNDGADDAGNYHTNNNAVNDDTVITDYAIDNAIDNAGDDTTADAADNDADNDTTETLPSQ